MDLDRDLNSNQKEAVMYNAGPCMVIAGAGSGKTRVLTYKISHLLELGVEPWSILALTFTNKAAKEMKVRIAQQVGDEKARHLWMGTFHSVFSRILRKEAELIGFTPNLTIYDQLDSKNLINSIIRENNLDEKVYKPSTILNRISNAKNRLLNPVSYASNREILEYDHIRHIPMTSDIYRKYCERCRHADSMDFDDLLFFTYELFKSHPDVQQKYSQQFRYVLVDEYQDTNYAQHCIVWQLTREHKQVCVVGDDAQSIYSFRGANIDNMLKFSKLYPEAKVFKLERNYRSTKTIVEAANSLIQKNREQIKKSVFSENQRGDLIRVIKAQSDIEEGDIVSNMIFELNSRSNVGFGDIAVLYRTNTQSRIFEESLRKRAIPYRVYGSLSFYQRKEIKNSIAYFRLSVNQRDEEALKRVINYPLRGIGATTINKLSEAAVINGTGLWEIIIGIEKYRLNISDRVKDKLNSFSEMILRFSQLALSATASEAVNYILDESGMLRDVNIDTTPEGLSRRENINELLSGVETFCQNRVEEGSENVTLSDYLADVSLLTDQDNDKEEEKGKVTLMTAHSSKGLEFDTVFIVGLEEDMFPSAMAKENERQIEEERRLFYVAMTRAENRCFLLYARNRFRYGSFVCGEPSRFIKDIDTAYLQMPVEFERLPAIDLFSKREEKEISGFYKKKQQHQYFEKGQERVSNRPFTELIQPTRPGIMRKVTPEMLSSTNALEPDNKLFEGSKIEHERFGIGTIVCLEGEGNNRKARIKFQNVGEKTLLLKFARITCID